MIELTTSATSWHLLHREVEVMGTVITIDLYGDAHVDSHVLAKGVDATASVLREADEVFSTWKLHSPLSRLRRGELTIDEVPPEVLDVFEKCREARRLSHGWFDPWSLPGGVDPTGLVKGWATRRSLDPLRGYGLSGALVNAAGDVASFGGTGNGEPFRIGVVRPSNQRQLACIVESPGAVATSGTYERGNHLFNPFTGNSPVTASATVTGPDLALADALATALAVAGPSGLAFINEIMGYEGLVVETSEAFYVSDGFPMVECFLERRLS